MIRINKSHKEKDISLMGKVIKEGTARFAKKREEQNLENKYNPPPIKKWKTLEGEFITFNAERIDTKNFPMILTTPKDIKEKKYIILQLHGGGYEKALLNYNTYFAKYYMRNNSIEVLTPNYRVAPEDKFPAALEDSVTAYKWLLENGYLAENIIIVGDSAGGGLALSTVMVLIKNKIKLPKAIITMSAWTDLACTLTSYKNNKEVDPLFGGVERPLIYSSRYAEGLDKTNPYISPYYGDFKGFPKMLMQVGTHEMLYDDTIKVADKARSQNVDVTLSEYDGMFHVFQAFRGVLKEANEAWDEVDKFIKEVFLLE